jgi:hypothetical protein
MQNAFVKKRIGAVIGTLTFLVLIALFVCLPNTSYGATIGSEKPNIYCTYTDSDGKQYDGDELPAGTYDVNFYLEGVSELSVVQVTAKYSADATVDTAAKSLLSGEVTGISSMGTITQNSNLVFGFVSDSDSCSAINSDGTLLATFSVAFANKCDASNVISVSTSPNETFVLTDYNDGLKDEYALVKQADDYDGSLYLMTCDVSPKGPGCDITGKITIATSLDGSEGKTGIGGINLTVKTADDSTVATAVTDSNGDYTLADIPAGEYKMLISGETTIDRTVTLVVSESKDVSSVSIAICDYNHDGFVNATDKLVFLTAFTGGEDAYNVLCDYTDDGFVNAADKLVFLTFFGNEVKYADVTLN